MLRRVFTSRASSRNSPAICRARNGSPGSSTVSAIRPGAASKWGVVMRRSSCRMEETATCHQRRQTQMDGHALADVGKAVATTHGARHQTRTAYQRRDAFAGVVAARPGRVAAVVGADREQVAGLQRIEQFRQPRIHHASKVMLKILQAKLQQYMNQELFKFLKE